MILMDFLKTCQYLGTLPCSNNINLTFAVTHSTSSIGCVGRGYTKSPYNKLNKEGILKAAVFEIRLF